MKVFAPFPEHYELIDAGNGFKLERWGEIVTIRPEHQAYFKAEQSLQEWRKIAHFEFIPVSDGALQGNWKALQKGVPQRWNIDIAPCSFQLELTSNKHIGLFPEQHLHWKTLLELNAEKRFLNLFAYTGAASCFARSTGASVTHVDSVKPMNEWGKVNMTLSGLSDIRWMHDDALKFVEKEIKRGNTYDVIQMDPPAWGLGAKREKWKLEDLLPQLLENALLLLNPGGKLILNTYSPKIQLNDLQRLAQNTRSGSFETGELWMKSTSGKQLYYGNFLLVERRL